MPKSLSAQRKHWIIFIIPPVLATVLYSVFVISSGFREPEKFSLPFLLQSILFFYIYLFTIQKADKFSDSHLPFKSLWSKQIFGFLMAFLISEVLTILLYAMLKQ